MSTYAKRNSVYIYAHVIFLAICDANQSPAGAQNTTIVTVCLLSILQEHLQSPALKTTLAHHSPFQ